MEDIMMTKNNLRTLFEMAVRFSNENGGFGYIIVAVAATLVSSDIFNNYMFGVKLIWSLWLMNVKGGINDRERYIIKLVRNFPFCRSVKSNIEGYMLKRVADRGMAIFGGYAREAARINNVRLRGYWKDMDIKSSISVSDWSEQRDFTASFESLRSYLRKKMLKDGGCMFDIDIRTRTVNAGYPKAPEGLCYVYRLEFTKRILMSTFTGQFIQPIVLFDYISALSGSVMMDEFLEDMCPGTSDMPCFVRRYGSVDFVSHNMASDDFDCNTFKIKGDYHLNRIEYFISSYIGGPAQPMLERARRKVFALVKQKWDFTVFYNSSTKCVACSTERNSPRIITKKFAWCSDCAIFDCKFILMMIRSTQSKLMFKRLVKMLKCGWKLEDAGASRVWIPME